MLNVVSTNVLNCVGCNRCTRECPVELANHTYLDASGAIKVRIDERYCIACGACIRVCAHDARYYTDDTERFFTDLRAGKKLTLIIAPSFKSNFPDYRKYLKLLRDLGVDLIYDGAFGADICVWNHLRYLAEHPGHYITQPCPAIVQYARIFAHDLLPSFIPVHSPLGCLAIYLRHHLRVATPIAAITPCLAKSLEFRDTGLIDYNITFRRLREYSAAHLSLPEEDGDYETTVMGLGGIFPLPGGLRENIAFFHPELYVSSYEGRRVYQILDQYAQYAQYARQKQDRGQDLDGADTSDVTARQATLPDLLDVLNCEQGCNYGPALTNSHDYFQTGRLMYDLKRQVLAQPEREAAYRQEFHVFDQSLTPERFQRRLTRIDVPVKKITAEDIATAFASLDKSSFSERNVNCGACGSASCDEMARKIALAVNIPENCMDRQKNIIRQGQENSRVLYDKLNKYIDLFHHVSILFNEHNTSNQDEAIIHALDLISQTFYDCDIYYFERDAPRNRFILKYHVGQKNLFRGDELVSGDLRLLDKRLRPDTIVSADGRNLFKNHAKLQNQIRHISIVPALSKTVLRGVFININDKEHHFGDDELEVCQSLATLIYSKIEENKLTEHLIGAREDAIAGTRTKSMFLSKMSHEIRTPLNAILGMTQAASRSNDINRLHFSIDTITRASNHLLGIVNDILDFSKIEANKLELNEQVEDLEQTIYEISHLLLESIHNKKQNYRLKFDAALQRYYRFDKFRLSQVLVNILSNATKFTPENGHITFTISQRTASEAETGIRFVIKDTGIGMSAAEARKIFHPFEQADETITSKFGGTGLGLPIAKGLIDSMGGAIAVKSAPGRGAGFIIDLPFKNSDAHPAQDDTVFSPLRIMIYARRHNSLAASINRKAFQRVTITDNFDEVRQELAAATVDVLVIDYAIDGIEWVHDRNFRASLRQTKILLMSSFSEWSDVERQTRDIITGNLIHPVLNYSFMDKLRRLYKPAPAPKEATPVVDLSGQTILLVDDVAINREVIKLLLESSRATIIEAENGIEAYDQYMRHSAAIDLILMDIQMPGMNGHEVTGKIRALPGYKARKLPIIAMTANAYAHDVEKALAAGMNAHLAKPIDQKELLEKVSKYLRRS